MSNSEIIKNRYDFLIVFDVTDGNPNGDPDAGNMPRLDPENSHGLVTNVCLKRKIRDYVQLVKGNVPGYLNYIANNGIPLETKNKECISYLGLEDKDLAEAKKDDPDIDNKIRNVMCQNYFDIRAFGGVLTTFHTGALNCGQIRGPVQIGHARSCDPIDPQEITLTRCAITTEKDAARKRNEMAQTNIVPYGLYVARGHISQSFAAITGFTEDDLQLLWEAIQNMFENDHSAARGEMILRELIIFKHDSPLGNAPAWKLFDLVDIHKKDGITVPRSFKDYSISVDTENLPANVSCVRC